MERVEYIRKNGRSNGRKKGVLWCGVDPDDGKSVIMGFSLCHSIDRFDYIKDMREPGFGLNTAKLRAEKWRFHTGYFIQKTLTEDQIDSIDDASAVYNEDGKMILPKIIKNPEPKCFVEIPPSVMIRLKLFIERCKKYYKDKEFPAWVQNVENGKMEEVY